MKITLKLLTSTLNDALHDLERPHEFAYERVGFFTAGVCQTDDDALLIIVRNYHSVKDEHYLRDPNVGASIGSDAMREAIQAAYLKNSALIHVHTHGGFGKPSFSGIDISSGRKFVPGFFHSVFKMPHGLMVLSNDSASAHFWLNETSNPVAVSEFITIGSSIRKFGQNVVAR